MDRLLKLVVFGMAIAVAQAAAPKTCLSKCHAGEERGFTGCLFNKTGNVATAMAEWELNLIWGSQAQATRNAYCYCNNECNPPQIVCEDPLLPIGSDLRFGEPAANVVAKAVYHGELWQLHCFCPDPENPQNNKCTDPPLHEQEFCDVPKPSPVVREPLLGNIEVVQDSTQCLKDAAETMKQLDGQWNFDILPELPPIFGVASGAETGKKPKKMKGQ